VIPQETVQLILDTARIEEVVEDFVTLKRRGANYVACCPFHNEKTPSFYVSPAKGIYKCFGCGKAGSAVGFVMEHEHCSYTDALKYIANKYHIEVVEEQLSEEEIERRQRSESLLLVSEFAQKYFAEQLQTPGEGVDAGYRYFLSRGLEDATIKKFGLGWAPSGRSGSLLQAAKAAGYKEEYLLDAGLLVQREDGTLADKFRERVMFPIQSLSGRTIAFSGRTLRTDNPAKYVNSPETEIYHKSNILMGIWYAKNEISRQDKCILVEGNLDLVMLHQLGITNVVAPCGTSLTVQQVRLIKKFTDNITLMNDGDSAGIKASIKDVDMILGEGMNVRLVLLPDGEDPDSYARKHTLAEMQEFIASNEKDFVDFKADLLLADAAGDPLKKANFINDIADTVARIPDAVKRSVYIQALSEKFGVEEDIIQNRVNTTRKRLIEEEKRERQRAQRAQPTQSSAPVDIAEVPAEQVTSSDTYVPENRILAPIESELLSFMLTHGTDILKFETDSGMYDPDNPETVAGFIASALEYRGDSFVNGGYRMVYDAYMALFDEGLSQEEILSRLFDSPDRTLAGIAADIAIDKHQLSVRELKGAMTATDSWLANYVPKSVLTYSEKKVEDSIDTIRRSLPGLEGEEQEAALRQIIELQKKQKRIQKNIKEKYK